MKKVSALFCFILFICSGFQPVPSEPDLSKFTDYVSRHNQLPESIKADCHWNYAIVKVFTNKNDVITRYKVLNYVSKDMNDMFKYLIGYRFAPDVHLHHRPVVFCYSVDNTKQECAVDQYAHSPTEVMGRALSEYGWEHKKNPNTILMYGMIIAQIYDTMR